MPPDEHEKPSTSILKERRFKLSRACDRCRRRRIKCDEGHPCQACISASSACTFEEPGKRAHPHKSKRTATLEDRMHHLETLIQAIPPAVFAASATASPDSASRSSPEPNASPLAPFMTPTHTYPSGIPPPSLHVFPLTNPSTHFISNSSGRHQSPNRAFQSTQGPYSGSATHAATDRFTEDTSCIPPLLASYLYFDDEGYTRWQGETSGLPLLDLLVERQTLLRKREQSPQSDNTSNTSKGTNATPNSGPRWHPNRIPRRTDVNPETLWRLITSHILPELMDSLVQCFLSTTHYLIPFLHVPTFLADYGNPQKWGEPGFAAFIVSICCVASRHIDDQRVRADPADGISAGTQWFELLGRLRTLPIADRPTLYTIQADLVAAIYAVGLGRLSKAAALLSEAVTVCIDAGLHRTADSYDLFDPIEDEVRKRTFWCVYLWDKQLSAHFGRPPMIRLRDCDVGEPTPIDDEFITHEGLSVPPPGTESKMSVFICTLRMSIVLESVVDVPPTRHFGDSSPFLMRATSVLLSGSRRSGRKDFVEEEALLDDIHQSIQPYWAHTPDTLASDDVIRVTQSVRLHCAEQFVRLFIYRHRFSELVTERTNGNADDEPSDMEKEATAAAQNCALQIISAHLFIATKGLMTYYGVHVIHQLTQAGRTLIAILLNCKSESMQHLIPPSLDALRSCVGLLRRFSSRYVCGVRCQAGELLEEFCQLTRIPLEPSAPSDHPENTARPAWIRPVPKRVPARSRTGTDSPSQHSSPEGFSPSEFFSDMTGGPPRTSPPPNGSPYHPGPAAVASGHHSPIGQSAAPQYLNPHGNNNGGHAGPVSPFIDTSGEMAMNMINPADAQMYMSSEVMALFSSNGGGVDVASLFLPEFQQQQQQQQQQQAPSDPHGVPGRGAFHGAPFQKMNGPVVMSP